MDQADIDIIANQTGCDVGKIHAMYDIHKDVSATIIALMNYKTCENRNKKTPVEQQLTDFRMIMAEKEQVFLARMRQTPSN
jgi:hypothetical protein